MYVPIQSTRMIINLIKSKIFFKNSDQVISKCFSFKVFVTLTESAIWNFDKGLKSHRAHARCGLTKLVK